MSGKLPDNFPSDYPVYGGAKVQGSYSGSTEGINGTVVTWETGDSLDKVKSFYTDAFGKGAWKADSNGEVNDSAYWSGSSSDGKQSFYTLASTTDGKTSIIATLGDKPADSSGGSNSTSTSGGSSSNSNKTATAEADSGSSGDSSSPDASSEKSPTSSPLPPEVSLAKDFPSDRVPFPSGARVTSSSSFGSGGSKTYIIQLYVKDDAETAIGYFSDEMPKHGWTNSFSSNSNGEYFVTFTAGDASAATNDGLTVSASPADTAGYTDVSLSVSLTAP